MTELDLLDNNELSKITLDDEFKREKKYTNSCGFDDDVLRRRDNEMKELVKLYPNMCSSWLELAWNYCEMTPKEEQDRIIASKEFEKPSTSKRDVGGVMKQAIKIETVEEYNASLKALADISNN